MTVSDKLETSRALQALKDVVQLCGRPSAYASLAAWAQAAAHPELARLAEESTHRLEEVEADYNRMCIGPYRLLVPPYESVWRSGGRVLNNRFSAAVEYSYAQAGLASGGALKELPDYFGNEIEFLYCLSALSFHYRNAGDGEAASELEAMFIRFWAEHLGHWAPAFLQAVAENAQEPFWKEWSRVLAQVLEALFQDVPLSETMSGVEEVPVAFPVSRPHTKD